MDHGIDTLITNHFLESCATAYYCNLASGTAIVLQNKAIVDPEFEKQMSNYVDGVLLYVNNYVHPEDTTYMLEQLSPDNVRNMLSKASSFDFTYRDISDHGMGTYRATAFRGEDEDHFILCFYNITEEVHKEQIRLLKEAKESQKLINSFAIKFTTVFMLNEDGTFITVKQKEDIKYDIPDGAIFADVASQFAGRYVYGPDREEFLRECAIDKIHSRAVEGKSYSVEFRVRNTQDGTRYWCEMVVRGMADQKVLIAIRPHDKEIVQRLIDEKLYKEYASIFLVDLQTDSYRFIFRNPESGFRDVPGGCYSDTIKEYASRVHPDFREEWSRFADVEIIKEILTRESRIEYTYPLEGINKRWRRCVLQLLDSEDGVPSTFIMTYITIDDTRAVEFELTSQIAKQKELLEVQQKQLQEALVDAQAASRAKTVFMNNMSHDIRTPLNAIIGFTDLALRDLDIDKDKVKSCLEKVGTSSQALLEIVNDILEISRIEAGKIVLERQKGDVLYSFVNIESMMCELARNAGLSLQFSFGNVQDRYVICDFAHAVRIFTNLISNAIKYTPRGGYVKVRCEQVGRRDEQHGLYKYTFEDNGIGMSEEFQKNLFQRFSREANSTVSKIQGSGLGLALCKDLVDLMEGSIECQSEKGKGTIFTVTLPFEIQDGQEYVIPGYSSHVTSALFKGKKVLLVEDNELNREISTAILEDFGFDVIPAEDGDIAVDMIKNAEIGDFDIILMDIQMPRLNGYEATRKIRAFGTPVSKIPIIAMTANAFAEDRLAAFESGMDGHLSKPIDIQALRETLAAFL